MKLKNKMGIKVDLADVIERTRELKRRLAGGCLALDPDDVFREPFLHLPHLKQLRDCIAKASSDGDPSLVAEAEECSRCLDVIIEALENGAECPPEDDLCSRFSRNEIDARTVMQITGWSPEELYDACSRRGLPLS
jgi:hypothetical protein